MSGGQLLWCNLVAMRRSLCEALPWLLGSRLPLWVIVHG
jgi:hypothetical protein